MKFKTFMVGLVFLSFACRDSALFDAGVTTTREIILPDRWLQIESQSTFDMVIIQDTIQKVEVTCGTNLQKFVSVSIAGDTLYLSQHTTNNWSRPYERIKLEFHTHHDVNINSRAPLHLTSYDTLRMSNFVVLDWTILSEVDVLLNVVNCNLVNSPGHFGNIRATGRCNNLYLWNRGSCIFQTDRLQSETATVINQGQGDMYVNVTGQLTVSLENTGNIYYRDNHPRIVIEKQLSTGQLIKH